MGGDFFFVIGIVLVIAAVAISFVGIRGSDSFPPSRAVMASVIVLVVAVVGTTMAFAVVKSVDEQDKRNDELAKEEPSNTGEAEPVTPGGQPQASEGGNQQAPEATGGGGGETTSGASASETIDVSSPEDGGLVFP